MIQRIQSLFLLAVAVLSGLLMAGDLIILDNGTGTSLFSGFCRSGRGRREAPSEALAPFGYYCTGACDGSGSDFSL